MRKEERKEKRPEKNVRPSPPSHYQPINYSSLHQSSREPTLSTLSLCAAARPLVPDSTSAAGPPHQRRRSSSLPQPPPDGAPAPPLQEGVPAGRQRRSRAPPPRIPGAGGLHPLSWGPDLAGAGAVEDEEGGGRRLLLLVTFLLLLSSPGRSFPLLFLSSCWASATPWPP